MDAKVQLTGIRIHSYFLLGFLTVQYILGMLANLYVQFPQNVPVGELWKTVWTHGQTAAHIIVGLGLVIGSIVFLIRATRTKQSVWTGAGVVGLVAVLGAFASGSLFVSTQSAVFSLTMSLFFLVAFTTYALTAFKSR